MWAVDFYMAVSTTYYLLGQYTITETLDRPCLSSNKICFWKQTFLFIGPMEFPGLRILPRVDRRSDQVKFVRSGNLILNRRGSGATPPIHGTLDAQNPNRFEQYVL